MRTELDQRMDAIMGALTAAGGQMALGSVTRRGVEMPVIAGRTADIGHVFRAFLP